jgi:microcompartment protein CcmK/EutM
VDVAEQFNSRDGANELQAAFAADLDGDGVREVVLVPRKGDAFEVLRRGGDGLFTFHRTLEAGEIDLIDVQVLPLTQEGADDVLLFGRDRFWLVSRGAAAVSSELVGSYETDLEGVLPTDVEAGDLRGNGRDLLIVMDQGRNLVEFAEHDGDAWLPFSHFVVFERDPHARDVRGQGAGEPRQAVLADVTGDGLTDLVLLVHDRLLVYPQQQPAP